MTDALTRAAATRWPHGAPGAAVALRAAAARRLPGSARGGAKWIAAAFGAASLRVLRCFRHQLLLPRPYLVLTKPLRLDIQCQRAASVKIGWKYLDD